MTLARNGVSVVVNYVSDATTERADKGAGVAKYIVKRTLGGGVQDSPRTLKELKLVWRSVT